MDFREPQWDKDEKADDLVKHLFSKTDPKIEKRLKKIRKRSKLNGDESILYDEQKNSKKQKKKQQEMKVKSGDGEVNGSGKRNKSKVKHKSLKEQITGSAIASKLSQVESAKGHQVQKPTSATDERDSGDMKIPKKSRRNKYYHLVAQVRKQAEEGGKEAQLVEEPEQGKQAEEGGNQKRLRKRTALDSDEKVKKKKRKKEQVSCNFSETQTDCDDKLLASKTKKKGKNRSKVVSEKSSDDAAHANEITVADKNNTNYELTSNKKRKRKKSDQVSDVDGTDQVKSVAQNSVSTEVTKKKKRKQSKLDKETGSSDKGNTDKDHAKLRNKPPNVESSDKRNIDKIRTKSHEEATKNFIPTHENSTATVTGKKKKPSLMERMQEKLKSARFRYLNEQLYTTTGSAAYSLFQEDNEAFQIYHEGFQKQVMRWPQNPLDRVIDFVKARPSTQSVADFGCGEARLAHSVPHKVHSFDLVPLHKEVIACDMSHVPLKANSTDIAVFCLSLMGTNLVDYLLEARRILKEHGTMLVVEVVSRIDKFKVFIRKLTRMGFICIDKDTTNKMFVWCEFKKEGQVKNNSMPDIELLPCLYKRR